MSRSCTVAVLTFLATSSLCVAQSNAVFVPVTPCRLVDTRQANGTFGGPALLALSYRTFPILSAACSIPPTATAYALNVTVVPNGVPLGYLSVLPAPSTIPTTYPTTSTLNSPQGQTVANAAIVPAGVSGAITVFATTPTDFVLDINGYFTTLQPDSTSGSTAFGAGALINDSGSGSNTGVGVNALNSNSSGYGNSALGDGSLRNNTTGIYNTALGSDALASNTVGTANIAIGLGALHNNTSGNYNAAVGNTALYNSTSGQFNIAIGHTAGIASDGSNNIFLGYEAGFNVSNGSNNIDIGNEGLNADSGVIRMGTSGNQSSTYIAGIYNTPVVGEAVVINADGQLGCSSCSSIRFKEDIHDIGDDTALLHLHPVSFHYKGLPPIQFGLIAEEVEKTFPDLVTRDADGHPVSVQYQELPALLLHEIQLQHKTIEDQQDAIKRLQDRLAALENSIHK